MPVQPVHEDGIVGRDRVDPIALRQGRAAPQLMVPVAAGDPFTRLQGRGVLLQPPNEFLGRSGVAQVDRRELKAAVDEVRMPIGEPGHDQPAVGAQDCRAATHVARDLCRVADREDHPVRDRDGPGAAAAGRQPGPDRPALDHHLGLMPTTRERQHEYREDDSPRTAHSEPPNEDG